MANISKQRSKKAIATLFLLFPSLHPARPFVA
uniref:Uncharacterized protein n=1 Tax=Nelumbo nucifera TaxID=4432 RepID=A0A822YB97_NELNU|nr:TPA_asm: hypothetical protein HUJ06_029763 [Nelumbo nucifera]